MAQPYAFCPFKLATRCGPECATKPREKSMYNFASMKSHSLCKIRLRICTCYRSISRTLPFIPLHCGYTLSWSLGRQMSHPASLLHAYFRSCDEDERTELICLPHIPPMENQGTMIAWRSAIWNLHPTNCVEKDVTGNLKCKNEVGEI